MSTEGRLVGGLNEKVKRSGSTEWYLQNSHEATKYSTGNIVKNIAKIMVPCGYWNIGEYFLNYMTA